VHNEKQITLAVPKQLNMYPEKVIIRDDNQFFYIETEVDQHGGFSFCPPVDGNWNLEFIYPTGE